MRKKRLSHYNKLNQNTITLVKGKSNPPMPKVTYSFIYLQQLHNLYS